MVEVTIDSIRVSLMSQHRVVILKDTDGERYLPIWIGPCEADAITVTLQDVEVPRPLSHDLMKNLITDMGGSVEHILIADLKSDVYYAKIVIDLNGQTLEIDSRPSDALALAVRVRVPIYVADSVMEKAVQPEEEVSDGESRSSGDAKLDAFSDFLDELDMDDLDRPGKEN
jgi:hypothetical protein